MSNLTNNSNVSNLYHSFANAQSCCVKYNPPSAQQVMENLNRGFELSLGSINNQSLLPQQQTQETARIGYNYRRKSKCIMNIIINVNDNYLFI